MSTLKLVDGQTLLNELFDEASRPTLRTLRSWQARRVVPFVMVGRLIFFDVTAVRESLAKRNTVHITR